MYDQHLKLRGIAHDINGLMASAMLVMEQLQSHEDDRVIARVDKVCATIDRVAEICRRELNPMTDPGFRVEMDAVFIEKLLQEVANVVAMESVLSSHPIAFFINVNDDIRLISEPQSLFRVIFNLTLNAANAIARNGGSSIEVSAVQFQGRVYFGICDDGPGLPGHVLEFLYPSLENSPCARKGRIGSGLITAVALASGLEGNLTLMQSDNTGTSFCLSLPNMPEDEAIILNPSFSAWQNSHEQKRHAPA
ncbi:MAG: HAMP domain-containing sensor histidine kinase [Pseudomonadota bacterium]